MSKDKAREFWITVDDHQCLDAYWREPGGTFQTFHVIEHKAYAALEAKLAECVAAYDLMRDAACLALDCVCTVDQRLSGHNYSCQVPQIEFKINQADEVLARVKK